MTCAAHDRLPASTTWYCALPLLWRDRVIGWANVATPFDVSFGWVSRERPHKRALDEEVERLRAFLASR